MQTGDEVTGPVNLGNEAEITIRELAEEIVALTGSRSRIVYEPLPQDDPRHRQPDLRLARELLGFEPRTALRTGLERTIAYFDALLADAAR